MEREAVRRRRRSASSGLLVAFTGVAWALAPTGFGASVRVDSTEDYERSTFYRYVVYEGAAGEANDVTVSASVTGETVTFRVSDPGAVIVAGEHCMSVGRHEAVCQTSSSSSGHDRLDVSAVVFLGDGNDRVDAGEIGGFLLGGTGDDVLIGGPYDDILAGGLGTDRLDGGDGADFASYLYHRTPVVADLDGVADDGSEGENDTLVDIENLQGGWGDDVLRGNDDANVVDGWEGRARDVLIGDGGDDVLAGGSGPDELFGGAGNDEVSGFHGADRLLGGPGDDAVFGHSGRDTVVGGNGRDRLVGGDAFDRLRGGAGADRLHSFDGDPDAVRGGPGRDSALADRGLDDVRGVEYVRRRVLA